MNLHMLSSENEEQYIWRLGQAKDNGSLDMSWEEIADLINKELGNEDKPFSEAAYRKPYQQAKKYYEAGVFNNEIESVNETQEKSNVVEQMKNKFGSESTINKDGTLSSNKLIEMNESDSKNTDYLLKAHGFDFDEWEIVSARNTIRQAISSQNGIVTLYLRDEREPFNDSELRQLKYILERWYDIVSFRREDRLTMLDMKVRK